MSVSVRPGFSQENFLGTANMLGLSQSTHCQFLVRGVYIFVEVRTAFNDLATGLLLRTY